MKTDSTASTAHSTPVAQVKRYASTLPQDHLSSAARISIEALIVAHERGNTNGEGFGLLADFDGLISCLLRSRNELSAAIDRPDRPEQVSDVLHTTVQRWEVQAGEEPALPGEPTYDLRMTFDRSTSQAYVTVASVAAQGEPSPLPQLALMVEINGGLPCAHIYGDIHGDVALSAFGKPGAQLSIRPGNAAFMHDDERYLPDVGKVIDGIQGMTDRGIRPQSR